MITQGEIPQPIRNGLENILNNYEFIDGFIIGGSAASGRWREGADDVDTYALFQADPLYYNETQYNATSPEIIEMLRQSFNEYCQSELHIVQRFTRFNAYRYISRGETFRDYFTWYITGEEAHHKLIYILREEARDAWNVT